MCPEAYKQRAKFLLNIFCHNKLRSGTMQVSAVCNIALVITKSMDHSPSFVTKKQCANSEYSRGTACFRWVPLAPIDRRVVEREGIKGLQVALMGAVRLEPSLCRRPLMTSAAHSAVDWSTTVAAEKGYLLQEFHINISFCNDPFILRGVVACRLGL